MIDGAVGTPGSGAGATGFPDGIASGRIHDLPSGFGTRAFEAIHAKGKEDPVGS